MTDESRAAVVALAHWLGDESNDLAILAEGNVSVAADPDKAAFWLKASGGRMGTMGPDDLVLMDTQATLRILDAETLTDVEIKNRLFAARAEGSPDRYPSTEAALHALCLTAGEAGAVGHTHPTPWLSILCSQQAEEAISGRIFPDEIVVCGPAVCFVSYVDPGPPLARACAEALDRFKTEWGMPPRVLLLRNHGLFALGKDPDEVKRVTQMSVKVARALIGSYALGGPQFLSAENVRRIHTRPDEVMRRARLEEKAVAPVE
jgi:rhamnose utilization protein RhaD (predicted bifunctional aldolase and dehydrogenase)